MADYVPKLGQLCDEKAERDAIHVAVVPVIAGHELKPGAHVMVSTADGTAWANGIRDDEKIGVVDPFLKAPVKKGEKFWLCLYPGTVISLRHHYRHPVLDAGIIRQETMEKLKHPAVERMKEWAEGFGTNYCEVLDLTRYYLLTGEEAVLDGHKSMNVSTDDYPKGGTFWGDYEMITNAKVSDEQKKDFFRCAC